MAGFVDVALQSWYVKFFKRCMAVGPWNNKIICCVKYNITVRCLKQMYDWHICCIKLTGHCFHLLPVILTHCKGHDTGVYSTTSLSFFYCPPSHIYIFQVWFSHIKWEKYEWWEMYKRFIYFPSWYTYLSEQTISRLMLSNHTWLN